MSGDISRFSTPLPIPGGGSLPRLLPGPLEGILTPDLCKVMTEFDLVPAWVTPFIRVSDNVPGIKAIRSHTAPFAGRPTVIQLMGTQPDLLAATAKRAMTLPSVLAVELNCACPSKTVMRKGSGAALLATPHWIPTAVAAMRRGNPDMGIGVKVRAGLESPNETPRIMEAVAEARPDWCVMHYRTASEFYRSIPDGWRRFDQAKAIIADVPLFASGDLFTVEDCLNLGRNHPIDGMTPARGLIRNPWLLQAVQARIDGCEPKLGTVADVLLRLAQLGVDNPKWKPGVLLEIAGMAWGRESDRFKRLVSEKEARGLMGAIKEIAY